MALPGIELEVRFQKQRASLAELRREIEKELRSLNIGFNTAALDKLLGQQKGNKNVTSIANLREARSSIASGVNERIAKIEGQIFEQRKKQARTLARLEDAAKEELDGSTKASRSLAALKGNLNKQSKSIQQLIDEQDRLKRTMAQVDSVLGGTITSLATLGNLERSLGNVSRRAPRQISTNVGGFASEEAASEAGRLENEHIDTLRAQARADADRRKFFQDQKRIAEKQIKDESKLSDAISNQVDVALRRARQAEQAGERDRTGFLLRQQDKEESRHAKVLLKNHEAQEKASEALTAAIRKQVDSALKRANDAEQAGVRDSASFLLKQREQAENAHARVLLKNHEAQERENEKLTAAIKKQVDAAAKQANAAEQAGIRDRASFLLKQKAEADAAQASAFFKEREKQQKDNQRITAAISKEVDTAIKRANQASQSGERDRASFLVKQKAEAEAEQANAFFKERAKQQKDNQKISAAISKEVDAAIRRADQAQQAGERDRAGFLLRKRVQEEEEHARRLLKIHEAAERSEKKAEAARARIAARLEAIDRSTSSRLNQFSGGGTRGGGTGGGGGGNLFGGGGAGGGGGGKRGPDFSGFKDGLTNLQKLKANLASSDKAAVSFGEAVRNAALRLGAWAAPSVFMFKTLGLLRDAVNEVIALDRETRRLIFFQTAGGEGGLAAFNNTVKSAADRTKLLGDAFNNITREATRTGLTINEVVLAANTVARIGQTAFDFKTGSSSDFLKATLALTKLEGGLLSADRAAEILQATMAQFKIPADDVIVAAAKIATTANETSFSIEELGTVITRFGSAALNIQNLTFDETLALASIAGKTLGTNASRAATALRQLTTKIAGNADEIERLTGIEVKVDGTGQLRGIEALFDVLQKADELKLTGFGEEITKLVADRENESDAFAFAGAIGKIREEFEKLKDVQKNSERTQEQVTAFLNQEGLSSDTVESSINRVNVAFTNLANSAGVQNIIKTFNNALTSILQFGTSTVGEVKNVEGALQNLQTVGLLVAANLSKKFFAGVAGAVGGGAIQQLRREVSRDLAEPFNAKNIGKPIERLVGEGLLNPNRADKLTNDSVQLSKELKSTNVELVGEQKKLNVLKSASVKDSHLELVTQERIKELTQQRTLILQKQQGVAREIEKSISTKSVIGSQLRQNAGTLIAAGALGFDTAFTDSISKAFESPKTQQAVKSGLSGAFTGAAFGAEIGSLFGPKGAVVGAIIGALGGLALSLTDAIRTLFTGVSNAELERGIAIDRAITAFNQRKRGKQFAEKERANQLKAERDVAERQGAIQARLFDTRQEILKLEQQFQEEQRAGTQNESLLVKLSAARAKEKRLENEISQRETAELERQLSLERDIAAARTGREVKSIFFDLTKQVNTELAQLNNSTDKRTPILVGLEIDKKSVISEIKSLTDEATRVAIDIAAVGNNPKDQQNRIRLEGQLVDIQKQILTKRASVINLDIEAQKKLVDISRDAAREVLDAFRTGLVSVNDALKSSIEQARRIVDTFATLREQFANANRFERDNPRRGIIAPGPRQLTNETKNFIKVLQQELEGISDSRIAARSEGFIGRRDDGGLKVQESLRDSITKTIGNMNELAAAEKLAKDATNFAAQARVELLKLEIQKFGERIDRERSFLDGQAAAVEKIISVQQERFTEEKKLVEIIRERAQQEAELGKSAINDPRQILENLRELLVARNLFTGINIGKQLDSRLASFDANKDSRLNQDELQKALPRIAQILDERVDKLGKTNTVLLQKVLKGIEFSGRLPGGGIGGLPAGLAEEIVSRAFVTSGKELSGSISAERDKVAEVESARQSVLSSFESLRQITVTRINFEKQIEEFEKKRVDVIKNQFENIQNVELPAAFNGAKESANKLMESLELLKNNVNTASTELEQFISGISSRQLNEVFGKLSELLGRIEGGKGQGGGPKGIGGGVGKIAPIRISQDSIEQISTVLRDAIIQAGPDLTASIQGAKVNVSVPDLQIQLNANVRKELQGDEFILKLTDALRESGLEDRVEQIRDIVIKLAQLEVNRGSDIPVPE